MKDIIRITIIIIICLFRLSHLSAQTCADCKDRKYPYRVCKNDKPDVVCTSDPQHIGDGSRVLKKCLSPNSVSSIIYDDSKSPYPAGKTIVYRKSGINYTVFSGNRAHELVEKALQDWINSCPNGNNFTNDNCDNCPLRVEWVNAVEDWKNLDNDPTTDHDPNKVLAYLSDPDFLPATGNQKDCRLDCGKERIVINGTNAFLGSANIRPPHNFLYTERQNKGYVDNIPDTIERDYYDFYGLIAHEIGHWLGFGHSDPNCVPGDNGPNPIMKSGMSPYTDQDITNDDKCRFMKLYCCPANSGVELDPENYYFQIGPNPLHSDEIKISLANTSRTKKLLIYDSEARLVFQRDIVEDQKVIYQNLQNFPSGKYLITFEFEHGYRLGRQLIIAR